MNILLFTIGTSLQIHLQAQYALRSLYVHIKSDDKLWVLTDSPVLYLGIPFVNVMNLGKTEIREWIGEGDNQYVFRAKLQAIRKFVMQHSDDHLVFLDCDTYCITGLDGIRSELDKGRSVMHKDEGPLARMKGDSGLMWKHTNGKTYAGVTISGRHRMWNSGVVGIPSDKALSVIIKAVQLCDDMLDDGVNCFNLEQWCIAIANEELTKGITEVSNIIGHYWHHKLVWCRYISDFFTDSYLYSRTVDEELDMIRKTDHKWLAKKLAIKRCMLKLMGKNNKRPKPADGTNSQTIGSRTSAIYQMSLNPYGTKVNPGT